MRQERHDKADCTCGHADIRAGSYCSTVQSKSLQPRQVWGEFSVAPSKAMAAMTLLCQPPSSQGPIQLDVR